MILTERAPLMVLLGLCIVALSAPHSHAQTADETTRELSNPANSLASLGNKFEVRAYDGDLPGAGDEVGYRYIFQPAFPFPRANGDKIIFRPAFNVPIDEPYFDAGAGDFRSGGGFGDIGFDLAYAPKTEGKVSSGAGIVGGLPTGTNKNLRGENWTLGPEIFAAYIDTWGLVGGSLPIRPRSPVMASTPTCRRSSTSILPASVVAGSSVPGRRSAITGRQRPAITGMCPSAWACPRPPLCSGGP
jgi:hypothetical protein